MHPKMAHALMVNAMADSEGRFKDLLKELEAKLTLKDELLKTELEAKIKLVEDKIK